MFHFRTHSKLNGRTPQEILEQTAVRSKYHFSTIDIDFIDTQLKKMQKMFPMFSRVRLKTRREDFYKKSVHSVWSKKLFLIDGYKRPVFPKEHSIARPNENTLIGLKCNCIIVKHC